MARTGDQHYFMTTSMAWDLKKQTKSVPKEWGTELIICQEPHAAKIMELNPDYQVSMHWHKEKSETFILIEGELIVETVSKRGKRATTHLDSKYSSITLAPMVPHTFYCPDGQTEPTIFIEASTTDSADDSYRMFPSGPRKK